MKRLVADTYVVVREGSQRHGVNTRFGGLRPRRGFRASRSAVWTGPRQGRLQSTVRSALKEGQGSDADPPNSLPRDRSHFRGPDTRVPGWLPQPHAMRRLNDLGVQTMCTILMRAHRGPASKTALLEFSLGKVVETQENRTRRAEPVHRPSKKSSKNRLVC